MQTHTHTKKKDRHRKHFKHTYTNKEERQTQKTIDFKLSQTFAAKQRDKQTCNTFVA